MKSCSQAIANKIIELRDSSDSNTSLTQLKLMKLVYFVHGFSLAVYNKPALNTQYDAVEAWKLGPVIPSLYYEFKQFGTNTIPNRYVSQYIDTSVDTITSEKQFSLKPYTLTDGDIITATKAVWNIYKDYNAFDLVNMTHQNGTPWSNTYEPLENIKIEDKLTKEYYTATLEVLKEVV